MGTAQGVRPVTETRQRPDDGSDARHQADQQADYQAGVKEAAWSQGRLRARIDTADSRVIVCLSGELDVATADLMRARPLCPLPPLITNPDQIGHLDIRRQQRLGGILNE